ncbi:MAG: histidinol dehydrogenase [Bacteroidales bacterium]
MQIVDNPPKTQWEKLCRRSEAVKSDISQEVANILSKVKENGDKALIDFAKKFEKADLNSLIVSIEDIKKSETEISSELKDAIDLASKNIHSFHAAQKRADLHFNTMDGVSCRRICRAIERVGLYVPGGTAPLFSTVLMLGIPAHIAGCKEIVLCTPPNSHGTVHPAILYAAKVAGITKIYKVGGAQSIAAMAYGTESIPKVDKVFGPGNMWVTVAKQQVSVSDVAIDMPAGPSEVLVLADESANAEFVAADLLSQAEHGADSQAIAIVNNINLAKSIETAIIEHLKILSRKDFLMTSLENSRIIILSDKQDMIEFSNIYAPEHLIISMNNYEAVVDDISNAGSIFLGNYSPESVGDYASGTNHTLPTHGWASSYSGVSLDSFLKYITVQHISQEAINGRLGEAVELMAESETLEAHKLAVTLRRDSN